MTFHMAALINLSCGRILGATMQAVSALQAIHSPLILSSQNVS